MNLEEIETMWAEDSVMNPHELDSESLNIPKLHAKYYRIYVREKLTNTKLKDQRVNLEHILNQFFAKTLTDDELDEYGLEYSPKKYLKPDIPMAVKTHKDMIEMNLRIAMSHEKCEFLKSILQMIGNRSFQVKDAINWRIFQAGG